MACQRPLCLVVAVPGAAARVTLNMKRKEQSVSSSSSTTGPLPPSPDKAPGPFLKTELLHIAPLIRLDRYCVQIGEEGVEYDLSQESRECGLVDAPTKEDASFNGMEAIDLLLQAVSPGLIGIVFRKKDIIIDVGVEGFSLKKTAPPGMDRLVAMITEFSEASEAANNL